jgi:hypothetical protein
MAFAQFEWHSPNQSPIWANAIRPYKVDRVFTPDLQRENNFPPDNFLTGFKVR